VLTDDEEHASPAVKLPDEQIDELRRYLLTSVRRVCPAWLRDQAEDIVQTSLIRLMGVLGESGGNPEPHPSYLKKAAYNATVDEMRRKFRHSEISEPENRGLDQEPGRAADPERNLESLEIHNGLRDCLAGMIGPRRAAVACHLQGYSVPEAARFLGWTAKRTEHLVRRGLTDLRGCLAGKGLKP